MTLSTEAQALFDHARNSVPRWLTRGKNTVLEWLYGYTEVFDATRAQAQSWLDITYILQAFGTDLDQHAKDRGITRRSGEDDLTLQQRIIQVSDAVTQPALEANINLILAANSLGVCAFVNLRRDRGHYQVPGFSTSFASRGYRMTYAGRPQGYIVILPYGTSAAIGSGVDDYLRQFGPAGFNHYVEIRANP
jgi:hypothetical protein